MLDRLGKFLVELTDSRRGRVLFVITLALIAGILEYLFHEAIETSVPSRSLARILDSATIAVIIATITAIEVHAVHQRRQRVIDDLRVVSELNHHVRNALTAIQYAARVPGTEKQVAIIDESVERIDATLRELFPAIDPDLPNNHPANN